MHLRTRLNQARRRLLIWCLVTLAGVAAMSAVLRLDLDGLVGIAAMAAATVFLVTGAFGMLWRLGQLQDEATRANREQSDDRTNGA